jgi:hypothetical protein
LIPYGGKSLLNAPFSGPYSRVLCGQSTLESGLIEFSCPLLSHIFHLKAVEAPFAREKDVCSQVSKRKGIVVRSLLMNEYLGIRDPKDIGR